VNTRISENQIKLIISLYTQGMTSAEIAEKVGVSSSSVLRMLKRNGVSVRSKRDHIVPNKFSEEKEQEIIRLYTEENKTTNEIAVLYNTYNTSIRRVLIRNNIPLRTYGEAIRKVSLEDIKSKEGTRDFDYFLGLLATDGCITDNKIVLDFAEQNKELLYYWNEFLGNKCNITVSIHKVFKTPQYRIAFRNVKIVEYLGTFGIVPRKTHSLTLKYINWDILRGIIDGDGCVSFRNNGTTLLVEITSGCREFLEQIQTFYDQNDIRSYLKESNNTQNPTYNLLVYNSEDIIKIYENLYTGAHFFLKRKEEKFGPLLKKFNKKSVVNSGKESTSNPEPSPTNREGVETLHNLPTD